MEVLTREAFIHTDFTGSGSGYGSGSCDGYGDGYGYGFSYGLGNGYLSGSGYGGGNGDGSGVGCGSGCGYSSGGIYGEGDGSGLKSINGQPVDYIDGIPTILTRVVGNVAKGFIVRNDLSLAPTYVCKHGNMFAHGETLHKAREALLEKLFDDMPTEERIASFCSEFKPGVKRHSMDFFSWHHRLTGSCEQGRREFARQHGVDLESDTLTTEEFFALTRDSYGKDIIRQTEEAFAASNGEIAEVEE